MRLEAAEAAFGSLHYKSKAHTILTSAFELATMPSVLDVVESMIGPNILLYNTTYIIKEPQTPSFVSWHQDLTYWGLSHDDQVTMWLHYHLRRWKVAVCALSLALIIMACISIKKQQMIIICLQGQTVSNIDEGQAKFCPLNSGEASFHRGWTLHASMNESETGVLG